MTEKEKQKHNDEKIKEAILNGLIDCRDAPDLGWSNFGGIHIDDCIAWLEKQDEQASLQTNERAWLYLISDVLTWKDGIGQYLDDPRVQELAKRLCSKYAQKLYNSSVLLNSLNIEKNKQKFDPKMLQPFDKILVSIDGEWQCDFFSHMLSGGIFNKRCMGIGDVNVVIPYNDETKHLVGTTEEAPDYYRYWDD